MLVGKPERLRTEWASWAGITAVGLPVAEINIRSASACIGGVTSQCTCGCCCCGRAPPVVPPPIMVEDMPAAGGADPPDREARKAVG